MAATINNFIGALLSVSDSLNTLREALVEEPAVSRTTHFAEAIVEWNNRDYILAMPLTDRALEMAKHAAVKIGTRSSKLLLEYRVLNSEMRYVDSCGVVQECDLILQELPAGERLDHAISNLSIDEAIAKIDQMEMEFKRVSLSHGNLKGENVILSEDGLLYPIRLHSLSLDSDCKAEFDLLRQELGAIVGCDLFGEIYEPQSSTAPKALNDLYGYRSVGNPFGGLCVAESQVGYGYITPEGEEIIAPQYLWAANMREDRAEVETNNGMGLIDSKGNYIIEPKYQIVEFDANNGLSQVKTFDGEWLTFDYLGRPVVG